MKCKVKGCDKGAHAKGYCSSHYYKVKRYGSPHGKPADKPERKCALDGCNEKHYGKGWCRKHYKQVHELGYAKPILFKTCKECGKDFDNRKADAVFCSKRCQIKWHRKEGCYTEGWLSEHRTQCSVDGCNNPAHSGDVCNKHNLRRLRHGDPLGGLPEEAPTCSAEGCDEVGGRVSGLCPKHYHNKYYYDNHDVERARRNARRSRVKDATPPWADMEEIRRIYQDCPDGHEVDHIIPICGKMISGLHVPENLQYLPISENRVKGNKVLLRRHELAP